MVPYREGMPLAPEELRVYQRLDYDEISEHSFATEITVVNEVDL